MLVNGRITSVSHSCCFTRAASNLHQIACEEGRPFLYNKRWESVNGSCGTVYGSVRRLRLNQLLGILLLLACSASSILIWAGVSALLSVIAARGFDQLVLLEALRPFMARPRVSKVELVEAGASELEISSRLADHGTVGRTLWYPLAKKKPMG